MLHYKVEYYLFQVDFTQNYYYFVQNSLTTLTTSSLFLMKLLTPSLGFYLTTNESSSEFRGARNPNNEFQHGGNVVHSLKMQVVSCFEKNHFMFEFCGKCRTLNVLIL